MGYVYDVLFIIILTAAAVFDLKKQIIPNILSLGILLLFLNKVLLTNSSSIEKSLINAAAGFMIALIVTGIPYGIHRSVGGGDVKLMSVCGLYCGARLTFAVLCCSFLLCAVCAGILMIAKRRKVKMIPFAPFILVGTIIPLLFSYLS